MNNPKDAELKELKSFIEDYAKQDNKEVWFYPEYQGVMGFSGTQEIILLGLNPSSGNFPSETDKLLYDLLKQKDLENIHITDLIKVRAKNKHVTNLLTDTDLMKKQMDFFSEELSIIKPKIIITMGIQCSNLLNQYFPKINNLCRIEKIKHPSFRYEKREKVFEDISESLEKIKKKN